MKSFIWSMMGNVIKYHSVGYLLIPKGKVGDWDEEIRRLLTNLRLKRHHCKGGKPTVVPADEVQ